MWYTWIVLLLVSCALVAAEGQAEAVAGAQTEAPVTATPGPTATPRAPSRSPPRTLDRQAAELAWRSWLQSPESGNPNAPARRITTKSLFITPLVCPKGQRLDRNGCVQVIAISIIMCIYDILDFQILMKYMISHLNMSHSFSNKY